MTLLEDFINSYPFKYTFYSDDPIGEGAYGAVYYAHDVDRGIPVAIKIYHDGIVPSGSERGWIVTSKINNPQISTTFTIESFVSSDGKLCKAVVSRFIPGKSLKKVFEWANSQTSKNRELIADDFVFSFLPSLLYILDLCHTMGYGHGDLHSGNVMATPTGTNDKFEFMATLIDFDNSSIKTDVFCATENEKIDKDCRSFATSIGIGPYIVMDWKWSRQVQNIFTSYSKMRDFKIAFDAILKYADIIDKGIVTMKNTLAIFQYLLHHSLNSFFPKPTFESLRDISREAGLISDFEKNLKAFNDLTKDYENWDFGVTITKDGHIKNQLYNGFFIDKPKGGNH
jgi:serine/threonine protein kinase